MRQQWQERRSPHQPGGFWATQGSEFFFELYSLSPQASSVLLHKSRRFHALLDKPTLWVSAMYSQVDAKEPTLPATIWVSNGLGFRVQGLGVSAYVGFCGEHRLQVILWLLWEEQFMYELQS